VTLLVTGAGGMLGRDVMRLATDAVGLTRAELDVADAAAVEHALLELRPDAVINCAGYTDVDGAESDEAAATLVNGDGAGNVAAAAALVGAFVVHPSTDYVFDGTKQTPYVESDPTGPRSAYGRSKLAGERTVAEATGAYAIVRTSWLFGVAGKNVVETMLRLGPQVRVVDDQVGCPTYTGHLARALLDIAESRAAGILHVAGAGACSWYEFAAEVFRRAGRDDVELSPCATADFPRPAPRPAYSVLRSERADAPVLADWRSGLDAYLEERGAAAR
jgi:dTDP-4-dehydrorhamnose reductase